ncbi:MULTISPECIES: glycoside hydrolase family 15 protein [unclassified Bradyrhizobium]|uniref:glycoside hydrolase family 15 protein n=1 Tax=Bradyrhizobium TaxID=374 RepID=UPI00035E0679|nr:MULTISPECIES: glycoside hydrolase family 15 protein [unclassified Bradyrhizobium]MCK1345602.1 glycoside hydrolase family 15 protein [Bradyrhizobium sp. CW11]MCK1414970.1 glycoside hydrolase family 15 protein [Bradyrhizobium sp. CW4]MCK1487194.1 glycoside hydrolase family 15 protein [Bradyrhizobium sp. 193]MCK1584403.1 glycoside hydrolase family 15 protein [Bradyrhizobium sp. 168]MCK1588714.1 glycoside hydrolase family 15 protein [Bradyrhizobium sp. 169]
MSQRIEDYALIGDCETAALVGRNGSIDWLCWPAFDSDACFAALLGTHKNGRWLIAPSEDVTATSRRYLGDTLILETRFETDGGTVALIDFMPPRGKASDIVRLVRGVSGTVKMRMELVIRFGFGVDIPWVRRIDHSLLAVAGQDMTVLRTPAKTRGEDLTTVSDFEVKAGETVPFVLTYGPSHLEPPAPIDPEVALKETEKFWQDWCSHCNRDGDYRDLIVRSLITLKALTFAPTGGIVAAPTTSLPEKLGGARNWDYRFCWLRDATFTLLALMNSGYTEEASAWHNWLLRAAAGSPANMQIMYGIWGQRRLLEWEAGWLDGYEGAQPVRVGNAAHAQLQLDVYGELIDAFHQSRMAKLKLDDESWALECAVLKHLAEVWDQPDHGIWERRGQPKHYVFSKVMTWVAFDRGIKSAETFGFKAPLLHWRTLRDAIHRDVCNRGFDAEENAFVESYGSKLLDASVLLLPSVGFLEASDPRIRGTIAAMEKHMMPDGFVLRHDPREVSEEKQPIEGAFLACSLWLADAHVLAGDLDKAQALFDRVVGVANDVGLLAEEYDSGARRQTGNFPQALTHIALVNTAHNLSAARQGSKKPAMQRSKQ